MAKVSITNQHDYMRFIINFGAMKVIGNFNRYEHTVKVEPYDGAVARSVSEPIDYLMKSSVNKTGGITVGQLFDIIKLSGERAKDPEQFIEFFKSDIEKAHGIVVRPFDVEKAATSTAEVVKDGRGWRAKATLENGDRISLKSSGKSVAVNMSPPITALMDEAIKLTFAFVGFGADAKTLMDAFAAQARQSSSTEEWIDNCRSAITPATVMKR